MINLKRLEEDFENISKRMVARGVNLESLNDVVQLAKESKEITNSISELRRQRNLSIKDQIKISKEEKKEIIDEENKLKEITNKLSNLLNSLPNIPAEDTPTNQEGNRVIFNSKRYHDRRENRLTYEEVARKVRIFSNQKGAKISGSKFTVYEGKGAQLLFDLINLMIEENQKKGYKLVSAPYIVNEINLYSTGQFPKFKEDVFKVEGQDLFLIPTSEVTLVNLYRDRLIEESELPIKLTSYTPCFRAEAGSAGQESKGLTRLHQFNKVEIVKIVKPDNSYQELEGITNDACQILDKLEITYRVIDLCYQELGFTAAKTYDIEIWLPNSKKWLEISSCSNCEDFQANRGKIRSKLNGKKNSIFLHTLNGSSLAIDRLILAILEYYYDNEKGELSIKF